MQLNIFGQHMDVTDALSDHVETRFDAALNQFDQRVLEVQIRLEDVNGPKGGVDKKCQATIHLRGGSTVVIEELHEDVYAAVSVAADRAKQVVGRKLDKQSEKR